MRFTTQLLPSRSGNLGVILLNNPKPLHALTLEMVHCLEDLLPQWLADDSMGAILVKSEGSKAFCAGGDVKSIGVAGASDGEGKPGLLSADFFRHEYRVNHMLATSKKPQISIWDGIVMGGGVGISVHGKYRVATENTVFAMPETRIGLFPDVGSMYWMPRLLQPSVAVFLALTGHRLYASDLLHAGVATHYVHSSQLGDLEDALTTATEALKPSEILQDVVAPVLMSFHREPLIRSNDSWLAREQANIDKGFGVLDDRSKGVEDILGNLERMEGSFGEDFRKKLLEMSPVSLKVTLEGLRRGARTLDIGDDLQMEYRMSQGCMRPGSDFFEGIRAALIDKDGNPQWNPPTLEAVSEEMVESYFRPIDHEWEIPELEPKSSKL